MLCCCAAPPGEMNKDLQPHLEDILEVVARYEFYTLEWIEGQRKELQPPRNTSFSQMDRRGGM